MRFHQSGLQLRTASNGTVHAVVRVATHPPDERFHPFGRDRRPIPLHDQRREKEKNQSRESRTKFPRHATSRRSEILLSCFISTYVRKSRSLALVRKLEKVEKLGQSFARPPRKSRGKITYIGQHFLWNLRAEQMRPDPRADFYGT